MTRVEDVWKDGHQTEQGEVGLRLMWMSTCKFESIISLQPLT